MNKAIKKLYFLKNYLRIKFYLLRFMKICLLKYGTVGTKKTLIELLRSKYFDKNYIQEFYHYIQELKKKVL